MAVYIWTAAAVAAVTAGLWVFLVCPRMRRRPMYGEIRAHDFAHRGLHCREKGIIENTLPAFRAAAEQHYGIELDVRLTRDGVPVVYHDASLQRLFGRGEKIAALPLKELRMLRFSSGETIPLLSEVLEAVGGKTPLLVELKSEGNPAQLCRAAAALLDAYGGAYCVESFDPRVLRWYRKNRPQVIRGQLITKFTRADADLPRPLFFVAENLLSNFYSRPDFISYNYLYRSNPSLRAVRKLFRLEEFDWTVSDSETYFRLKKDGVLCIFENFQPRISL